MTEEEAKTKWCPFVRQTSETDNYKPATNRFEVADASAFNCIGSACMAWRRDTSERAGPLRIVKAVSRPSAVPDQWHFWTAEKPMAETWGLFTYGGYCGMAGKP